MYLKSKIQFVKCVCILSNRPNCLDSYFVYCKKVDLYILQLKRRAAAFKGLRFWLNSVFFLILYLELKIKVVKCVCYVLCLYLFLLNQIVLTCILYIVQSGFYNLGAERLPLKGWDIGTERARDCQIKTRSTLTHDDDDDAS